MNAPSGTTVDQRQTTKGRREPWRGTWGGFDDGRTRLSRRKREDLNDLLQAYGPLQTRAQYRRAERIAGLRAQAAKVQATMTTDPKSTARAWTALLKLAAYEETRLLASLSHNGHGKDSFALLAGPEERG